MSWSETDNATIINVGAASVVSSGAFSCVAGDFLLAVVVAQLGTGSLSNDVVAGWTAQSIPGASDAAVYTKTADGTETSITFDLGADSMSNWLGTVGVYHSSNGETPGSISGSTGSYVSGETRTFFATGSADGRLIIIVGNTYDLGGIGLTTPGLPIFGGGQGGLIVSSASAADAYNDGALEQYKAVQQAAEYSTVTPLANYTVTWDVSQSFVFAGARFTMTPVAPSVSYNPQHLTLRRFGSRDLPFDLRTIRLGGQN